MIQGRTEPSVAKIPKTLAFHEDVARLVQAYADKKGSNFQRVVQAAVLQFFFSSTDGPDEDWMTAFVELEKGSGDPPLDLSLLPMKVWEGCAHAKERKLASYRQRHPDVVTDQYTKFMEQSIMMAYHTAGVWRGGIDLYGGGVDGTIERAIASGIEQSALMHRIDRMETEADEENE